MAFANLGDIGNAFVTIEVDQRQFGQDLDRARGQLKQSAQKMSADLQAVGRTLVGIGAVATGAFAGTIKVASDFESSFAGVRKTVDATEDQFKELETGIARMAAEIPVGRNELAGIMEVAGQLGVRGVDNLLKFTRVAADLGATTNLSSEEAATALARFINVTGGSFDQIDRLGSVVVALGNNFATTESEIVNMAQRLSGLAPAAGFTQEQIFGLAAALSSVGVEAELGGTAVQRLVINMIQSVSEGGDALESFARVAGMTSEQFAELVRRDPSEALRTFFSGLNRINEAGGDLFATLSELGIEEQRLIQVITKAAGAQQLFADANTMAAQAFEENTALTEEANKRYETFASQVTIAKNAFLNLVGELGTPAMKALGMVLKDEVIPAIRETVTAVSAWIEKNPELAGKIILAVGALGALLVAVGSFLIILGPLIAGMAALIGPVGAVAAGIMTGLVVAFGILALATDEMKARLQEFMAFLINVFTGHWGAAWENMKNVASSAWSAIQTAFSKFANFIIEKIKAVISWIGRMAQKLADTIPGGSFTLSSLANLVIPGAGAVIPRGKFGGSILDGGVIDVHKNERIMLPEGARIQRETDVERQSGGPVTMAPNFHFHGDVYGPDDLLNRVNQGLARLQQQSAKSLGTAF